MRIIWENIQYFIQIWISDKYEAAQQTYVSSDQGAASGWSISMRVMSVLWPQEVSCPPGEGGFRWTSTTSSSLTTRRTSSAASYVVQVVGAAGLVVAALQQPKVIDSLSSQVFTVFVVLFESWSLVQFKSWSVVQYNLNSFSSLSLLFLGRLKVKKKLVHPHRSEGNIRIKT